MGGKFAVASCPPILTFPRKGGKGPINKRARKGDALQGQGEIVDQHTGKARAVGRTLKV